MTVLLALRLIAVGFSFAGLIALHLWILFVLAPRGEQRIHAYFERKEREAMQRMNRRPHDLH